MSSEDTQPNVVWIMADDLGWGDLGCYGQQITKTETIRCLLESVGTLSSYLKESPPSFSFA